jgi:glutamate synthase (NADPH) small chain
LSNGFLTYTRETPEYRPVSERLQDFKEVYQEFPTEKTLQQATRCMNCGVPFCHNGCPLGNLIPDFNSAVQQGNWKLAYNLLSKTNNFPEFTGRICPAPCESACVLAINQPAVAIEHIEKSIIEKAFEAGYIQPRPPQKRTGKTVAIVGSGPAGLAAADELNKKGHTVTVFEKSDRLGGLLRYGIPDFKMEKWVIDRRIALLETEGVQFKTSVHCGEDISGEAMLAQFDAILLCTGALVPRDVPLPGRNLEGVHYAMDYLELGNRQSAGEYGDQQPAISAKGKHVIVIGGGDTGSDCVGTANRQGALSVTQLQYHVKPPDERSEETPWPLYPMMLTTSSSHDEGCERRFAVLTREFTGKKGKINGLMIDSIDWITDPATGKKSYQPIPGGRETLPCDLALIAVGYSGTEKKGLLEQLQVSVNERGNVETEGYRIGKTKVFSAGDSRRGQSWVVWAIAEGREAAAAIHNAM